MAEDLATSSKPRVFAVLAVFNRSETTLACIEQLKQQTYPNVEIVVSDGGSTDGTAQLVRKLHPEVTVIADVGEQWWTGSTWYGIEHALRAGGDDDLVLLLNDDTTFPPDLVEVLADEAVRHCAAVEALQVAERDHETVLCAGARFDWDRYRSIPLDRNVPSDGFDDRTDLLDGRATIVPLTIIRDVGNVRRRALPHYCADSELSFRISRAGYATAVTHRTWVAIEEREKPFAAEATTVGGAWRQITDRRSMSNLRAHVVAALLSGPPRQRWRVAALLLAQGARRLVVASPFLPIAARVRRVLRVLTAGPAARSGKSSR